MLVDGDNMELLVLLFLEFNFFGFIFELEVFNYLIFQEVVFFVINVFNGENGEISVIFFEIE